MDPTIYQKPKNKISAANIIFAVLAIAGIGFGVYGMLGANKPAQTENFKVQIVNNDGVVTKIETDKIEQKDDDKIITITDNAVIIDQTARLLEQLRNDTTIIVNSYMVNSYFDGEDTYEQLMIGLNSADDPISGAVRTYYRAGTDSEWQYYEEGQGVGQCSSLPEEGMKVIGYISSNFMSNNNVCSDENNIDVKYYADKDGNLHYQNI